MKRTITLILSIAMMLTLLVGCGSKPASDGGTITDGAEQNFTIKLGHACSAAHPYNQGAEKFKEIVESETDGHVTVEIYTDSTLGAERDLIEGMQMGSVEMAFVSTSPLSSYTDSFLAFDLPYLLTSKEQARAVVDSEIGQNMLDTLRGNGLVGLCYFENGFRHFTNDDHVIDGPEDLKGMKIRVMENQVMMETITACGGDPTPMAFNELYTALQQRTIDGEENPISQIYDKKMYEVQHYISISNHFYGAAPVLMSATFYDSLPAEYQEIIQKAAIEARDYMRSRNDIEEEEQLNEMINTYGCEVCYDVDIDAFRAAVQPVYDKFVGDGKLISGDLVKSIQDFKY